MHPSDLDIALSTLDEHPDDRKQQECREEARRLLMERQISAQRYSDVLMRLKRSDPTNGAIPGVAGDYF
jgi:hypothetical protein